MAKHVGAIPSMVGGRNLTLCHVSSVFRINADSMARFRKWYRFLLRDQLIVWMPACFIGAGLPSMLSVQFLTRRTQAKDWVAAGMTADGLRAAVGPTFGTFFWLMTLFAASSCPRLRRGPHLTERSAVGAIFAGPVCRLYGVGILTGFAGSVSALSAVMPSLPHRALIANPKQMLVWATMIYNSVLGISCFYVLATNVILLPREFRPNWFIRVGLALGGLFFRLGRIAWLNTLHYFDPK